MRWRAATFIATGVFALVLTAASVYAWTRDSAADEDDSSSAAELVERGRLLFASKGCITCHDIAARNVVDGYGMAPDLSSLPDQAGERVEGMSAEEYVRVSILNPDAFIAAPTGTFGMPQLPVTGDEIDALVAFLLEDGT